MSRDSELLVKCSLEVQRNPRLVSRGHSEPDQAVDSRRLEEGLPCLGDAPNRTVRPHRERRIERRTSSAEVRCVPGGGLSMVGSESVPVKRAAVAPFVSLREVPVLQPNHYLGVAVRSDGFDEHIGLVAGARNHIVARETSDSVHRAGATALGRLPPEVDTPAGAEAEAEAE
jgi:hypothetical protein